MAANSTEMEDMEETRGYSIARRPATAGAVRSPSTTSVSRQPAVALMCSGSIFLVSSGTMARIGKSNCLQTKAEDVGFRCLPGDLPLQGERVLELPPVHPGSCASLGGWRNEPVRKGDTHIQSHIHIHIYI